MSIRNVAHKNEAHVHGVLANEPAIRYTPSGKCVANLTLVTRHDRFTEFHKVTAWEKLAEKTAQLKKGDFLQVVGRLQTRSWEDKQSGQKKYTTEIIAFQLVIPAEELEPLTPDATKTGKDVARAILRPAKEASDAEF
jgi:single stranded DNA-binding protein